MGRRHSVVLRGRAQSALAEAHMPSAAMPTKTGARQTRPSGICTLSRSGSSSCQGEHGRQRHDDDLAAPLGAAPACMLAPVAAAMKCSPAAAAARCSTARTGR